MAALIFKTVDFTSSGRHPSEFALDPDLDLFNAGVSPTSSPFVMSTRNSIVGCVPDMPPHTPLVSMGELEAKFSKQSIEPSAVRNARAEQQQMHMSLAPSAPPTPPLSLSSEFDSKLFRLHSTLPTPPGEDDCIPNDLASHLLTPPPSRRPTNAHLLPTPRNSTSAPSSEPAIDYTPTSHPSSPRASNRLSASLSYGARYLPELQLDDCAPSASTTCDSRRDSGYSHDGSFGSEKFKVAADHPSILADRRSSFTLGCCDALRDIYRRRSTSAAMDVVGAKAIGARRLRARKWAEEQSTSRRRTEDCGISKASRYRRSVGRRGAVSY